MYAILHLQSQVRFSLNTYVKSGVLDCNKKLSLAHKLIVSLDPAVMQKAAFSEPGAVIGTAQKLLLVELGCGHFSVKRKNQEVLNPYFQKFLLYFWRRGFC